MLVDLYFPQQSGRLYWPARARPPRPGRGLHFYNPASLGARTEVGFERVRHQLGEYLAGRREDFDLRLDPRGTDMQRRVWDSICQIPYGSTCTYSDLARQLGVGTSPLTVAAEVGTRRDTVTGSGDASGDAEIVANALGAVFDGSTDEASALAAYQLERDATSGRSSTLHASCRCSRRRHASPSCRSSWRTPSRPKPSFSPPARSERSLQSTTNPDPYTTDAQTQRERERERERER